MVVAVDEGVGVTVLVPRGCEAEEVVEVEGGGEVADGEDGDYERNGRGGHELRFIAVGWLARAEREWRRAWLCSLQIPEPSVLAVAGGLRRVTGRVACPGLRGLAACLRVRRRLAICRRRVWRRGCSSVKFVA